MVSIVVHRSSQVKGLSRSTIQRIVDFVSQQENQTFIGKLSIAFVEREEARKIKKDFFHQDCDTDVISFFYGKNEPDDIWGEIIISPEKAIEQAQEFSMSFDQEMKLLLIHGLLHLFGYNDIEPSERTQMEKRQGELLDAFLLVEKRESLVRSAQIGQHHAYAPYSRFAVGAAIETCDGKVISGGNIENASYGLSICAERVTLFKAISMGYAGFVRMAIISSDEDYCLPCGACRQVLHEFASHLEIVAARHNGDYRVFTLYDLFPYPFDFNQKKEE